MTRITYLEGVLLALICVFVILICAKPAAATGQPQSGHTVVPVVKRVDMPDGTRCYTTDTAISCNFWFNIK